VKVAPGLTSRPCIEFPRVVAGIFKPGDKVVLKDKSGKNLLEDSIARLEIGREKRAEVSSGNRAGILLKEHSPGELLRLGISLYQVHVPQTTHPYRL
jgi:hypothetical protein